jgi:hypothetical protein
MAVEEIELNILHLVESAMAFAPFGIHKVLDLGHQELSDTQETGPRRDLVAIGLANGCGSKQCALVEFEELGCVKRTGVSSN